MRIMQEGKIPQWEVKVKCKLCNTNYALGYKDISPMVNHRKFTRVEYLYKCPECGYLIKIPGRKIKKEIRQLLTSDIFY